MYEGLGRTYWYYKRRLTYHRKTKKVSTRLQSSIKKLNIEVGIGRCHCMTTCYSTPFNHLRN